MAAAAAYSDSAATPTASRSRMNFTDFPKILAALVLILFVSGCARVTTVDEPHFREDAFKADPPKTLAIAPFENATGVKDAAPKMREAIYGALSGLNYTDVELNRVDQIISEQALRLNVRPDEVRAEDIAIPEMADAVVFGRVDHASRLYLFLYAQYRIDVNLAMYSTRTRQQIYSNDFIVRNRKFTLPTGVVGLVKSFFSTLWFMRTSELEESYEEVAQQIAERFPPPPGEVGQKGIFIEKVDVDVARESLRAGDRVVVRVDGAPGKVGTFSVGTRVVDQPLRETAPGQYSGMYVIQPGDDARYVFVRARLRSPEADGESIEADAASEAFLIDTAPPVSYAIDTWAELPGKQGLVLSFAPEDRTSPQSEDVPVAFHVFRGLRGGDNLAYLGTTQETRYTDTGAQAGVEYEYAIVAVDAAGNQSPVRTKVRITPAP